MPGPSVEPASRQTWPAALLVLPAVLQAVFNLGPGVQAANWRIFILLALLGAWQWRALRRGHRWSAFTALGIEIVALASTNLAVLALPPPDFTGASRFNEGMLWLGFACFGGAAGSVFGSGVQFVANCLRRRPSR